MVAMAMGEAEPADVLGRDAVGAADLDDAGKVAARAGVEHHPALTAVEREDRAVIGVGQVEAHPAAGDAMKAASEAHWRQPASSASSSAAERRSMVGGRRSLSAKVSRKPEPQSSATMRSPGPASPEASRRSIAGSTMPDDGST